MDRLKKKRLKRDKYNRPTTYTGSSYDSFEDDMNTFNTLSGLADTSFDTPSDTGFDGGFDSSPDFSDVGGGGDFGGGGSDI